MAGIKDLVGLLFWMDNKTMSTMKAVSDGERDLPKNKADILRYIDQKSTNGRHHPNGKLNGTKVLSKNNRGT